MKKLLLLLLILPYLAIAQSADATPIENILLTNATEKSAATRVTVQDSLTKELGFILKSTLNTNISIGQKNSTSFGLFSSTGTGVSVPQATTTDAGLLNSSDKIKINSITAKVANTQALIDYVGLSDVIIVQDNLRGGIFNYILSGLVADNGIVFEATGKGGGFWQRQYTQANGRFPEWYGAKGDFIQVDAGGTGTNDAVSIQACIDSYPNRNGLVVFTRNYRLSSTIQLGEGTYLKGNGSLFPYQLTSGPTIYYKNKTALWFDSGVNGLTTTQDAVDYRNQAIKIEYLGIFSNGDTRTSTGLSLINNNNSTSGLVKPGLPAVAHCYFSGWDIAINGIDTDSFDLNFNHFSEVRIGVIGGSSELYSFRNDFYNITETGLIVNGINATITHNEFEPTTSEGVSLILNTDSQYAIISHNSFRKNKNAILINSNGLTSKGHHNITENVFYEVFGESYIILSGQSEDINIVNNNFKSDSNNLIPCNFITVNSGAKNISVNNNSFEKRSGGLVNKSVVANGVINFQFLNNKNIGSAPLTDLEFLPSITNTTVEPFKTIQSDSNDWDNTYFGLQSSIVFNGLSSYASFSNIPSLFSNSGSVSINFKTSNDITTPQFIIGGFVPRFYLRISSGNLNIILGDNTSNFSTIPIKTSSKYNLVFIWNSPSNNGSGNLTIYLNSLNVGTFPFTNFTALPSSFALGRNSSSDYFKGEISSFKIFNTILSESEIYNYYRFPDNTIHYLKKGNNTIVNATTILSNNKVRISTIGTTDYTLIGASSNTVGLEFITTGIALGTGTVVALGALIDISYAFNSTQWADLSGNGNNVSLISTSSNDANISKWVRSKSDDNKVVHLLGNEIIAGVKSLNNNLLIGSTVDNGVDKLQVTGSQTNTGQIKSTIITGTAPLVLASTTKVINLNADLLDGLNSSVFELNSNKQNNLSVDGTGVKYSTVDAVNAGLNLKANIAGENNFTGNQNTLSGIVKVGNRPVSTRAISFSSSLNDFVIDNTTSGHSFEESSRLIANTNNASFGFYDAVPTITSTGAINLGHLNGFQSRIRYEGAASFTNDISAGIRSFYSDIFISGSGNVPYTAGLYIQNATVTGTGRVQNQHGIIIGDLTAGTVSNRGITSYTYRNFLRGLVIGSDVPDAVNALSVDGNVKFTGQLLVGTTTDYSDNAAAIAGGLEVGQVYRTGDLLKIVH